MESTALIFETDIRLKLAHSEYKTIIREQIALLLDQSESEIDFPEVLFSVIDQADHLAFKKKFGQIEKKWNQDLKTLFSKSKSWTTHRRKRKGKNLGGCPDTVGDAVRLQVLLRRPIKFAYENANPNINLQTSRPSLTVFVHAWPLDGNDFQNGAWDPAIVRLFPSCSFFQHLDDKFGIDAGICRFQHACKSDELQPVAQAIQNGQSEKVPNLIKDFVEYWFGK